VSDLYFAYASNMCSQKMKKFAPQAEIVDIGHIVGWEFCLTHKWHDGSAKATIVPVSASEVWGVIYRVSSLEMVALDTMEHLGREYEKLSLKVFGAKGTEYDVSSYVGLNPSNNVRPNAKYCRRIIKGAAAHNLPKPYLFKLIDLCFADRMD